MRFSIVTPVFNAARYIRETVDSVLGQTAVKSGRSSVQYIVRDGGSTDGTLEILRTYGDSLKITSAKDTGVYDALASGLAETSGDACAYLNAGDFFHPTAFDVVDELFERSDVKWLTGMAVAYNDRSQVIEASLPFRYRRAFIAKGVYGTRLRHIQQESTFWRTELNALIDSNRLRSFRLAGDAYLWRCFAAQTELFIVSAHLGGFRLHPGQLSSDRDGYRRELLSLSDGSLSAPEQALAAFDAAATHLPMHIKKRLNPRTLFLYDPKAERFA